MGIEKRAKEIDGHAYTLTTLGARQGQRILLRLAKIAGPALAEMVTKGDFSGALRLALESATEQDLDYLIDTFATSCKLIVPTQTKAGPGQVAMELKTTYDAHFQGRYLAAFEWLMWCLEENFADFFGDKGLGAIVRRKAQASEHQKESTGSSGE